MNNSRRTAVLALAAAGMFWGSSMALSKLSLTWLGPAWLTVLRFGLAAAILAIPARRELRAAFTPQILGWGAFGLGGCIVVQNIGLTHTSVSHASLMVGAVPVIVAVVAAAWHRTRVAPLAWVGLLASFGGVAAVAGGGGGGSSMFGDLLVLTSLCCGAVMTVAQVRMLEGRDPMAVTAVQFMGGALAALPIAAITEGAPSAPASAAPVLGLIGLTVFGTMLPWTLFAFGQARVSAVVAGAFLNIEPLVGATLGAVFFGDAVGAIQLGGGLAILAGVALSTVPVSTRRTAKVIAFARAAVDVTADATVAAVTVARTVTVATAVKAARVAQAASVEPILPRLPVRAGAPMPRRIPAPRPPSDGFAMDDVSADSLVLDRWAEAA